MGKQREFRVGDPVRLRFDRSKELRKGLLGVITDVRHAPRGSTCTYVVTWRGPSNDEHIGAHYLKHATPQTISQKDRVWLVKRRLSEAA